MTKMKRILITTWVLFVILGAVGGLKFIADAACCGTGPNVFRNPLYAIDGQAAYPSYSFNSEAELGWFRSGGSELSFAIPSGGGMGINQATPLHILHVKSISRVMKLESKLADASGDSGIILYRNPSEGRSTPTGTGIINFTANDSAGVENEITEIEISMSDDTVGQESGILSLRTATTGVLGPNQRRFRIQAAGHMIAGSDNVYDLGSSGNSVRNLYVETDFVVPKVKFSGKTFSGLGSPANGSITYCSNCTKATPCAGTGNGAWAKRLNGAWDCD